MDPLFAAVIQNKTFYNKFLATIKEMKNFLKARYDLILEDIEQ